jgi:hypothetical protein
LYFSITEDKIKKVIDIPRKIKILKFDEVLLTKSNVFNILISNKKIKINNEDTI